MTATQQLAWLIANTVSLSIDVNDQATIYRTLAQHFDDDLCDRNEYGKDPEIRAECLRTGQLVEIWCYPDTPVGSFKVFHFDIEQAIAAMFHAVTAHRAQSKGKRT